MAASFTRPPRERSLSIPLPPPTFLARRRQKTNAQKQSALFNKLPAEIRQIIWEYVIADEDRPIHILQYKKRLRNMPCSNHRGPGEQLSVYTGFHKCTGYEGNYGNALEVQPGANLSQLVKTCRQIYTEAIDVLYSQTAFRIEHLDTLTYFSTFILPHHFNRITTLRLLWFFHIDIFEDLPNPTKPPHDLATWQQTCDILAGMEGLVDLDIELSTETSYFKKISSRVKLLQTMKDIKPKGRFDLTAWAPWPWLRFTQKEEEEDMEGVQALFSILYPDIEGLQLEGMPFRIIDTKCYYHSGV
ncbi:uncharacterized protein BDZ99DRAFT_462114 [Mytilinidion resinicola]|uniref:DUF7730 domain-containing protein n=1 Tax=Mytilinidion resinicola TaxID=574789 RepID=A0A6A6YS52_9PEZI|nr:uncharacterized protein BDZ99DRAFT_462114 [Mytilinidion resinicola]KAF2810795.1 hypothetical protein BDZ99DRAFT_462114 [Mytilinidion resinicola]